MFHGKVSTEIAKGLRVRRRRIEAAKIPASKLDETLNIASWNIREFGKTRRTEAAIHYIAEILGQFDLVSIVELRDDLTDLGRVPAILEPYWRAVYSDMIPDHGGNRERLAFIYDRRAVDFTGLAATAGWIRSSERGAETGKVGGSGRKCRCAIGTMRAGGLSQTSQFPDALGGLRATACLRFAYARHGVATWRAPVTSPCQILAEPSAPRV